MTSQRPYNRQFTLEEAVVELATHAGTQFDPALVGVFIDALTESDTVELSDETVAAAKAKVDDISGRS
jgi:HD-GYP domain-containing protein (c-di-GMP phosphodiesterase class II)